MFGREVRKELKAIPGRLDGKGAQSTALWTFGPFEVDLESQKLHKYGIRIKLQEQPFRILALLLEYQGKVVSREELRRRLWPGDTFVGFDGSLSTAMNKLRSALSDSAENPRYIETVPRQGYRWIGEVTPAAQQPLQAKTPSPDLALSTDTHRTERERHVEPAAVPPSKRRYHLRSRRYALGLAGVVLLITTPAYFFLTSRSFHRHLPAGTRGSSAVTLRRSVAVLGFKNLSGQPDLAWLSTALSEWMATELSASEQLRTIPAETVSRMKMELALSDVDGLSRESLAQVRKNLGTDLVLAGSYAVVDSKSGDRIRLDLRLQDTQTGETTFVASETGTGANLFDLVSKCGRQLHQALAVQDITPQQANAVAMALPSGMEVTRFYSEGMARLRVLDARGARDLLQKAVAAEPDFALSHAGLAAAWDQLGYEENAKTEAGKAFALSSNLPRAARLLVEARYHEMSREWQRAIDIYRALFEFFPDNLEYGLALANTQNSGNRWNDALATAANLRELPAPLRNDPRIDLVEAEAAYSLGDSAKVQVMAAQAAEKALVMRASLILARALLRQAWALEDAGRVDEAEDPIQRAKQLYLAAHDLQGAADAATAEGSRLEMRGDRLGALKIYRESLALYDRAGNKHAAADEYTRLGQALLALGDGPEARRSYGKALAISMELDDQEGVAWAKIGLGDIAGIRGKHADAKRLLGEALDISRRIECRDAMAGALAELGIVLRDEGDLGSGEKNELEGLSILREIGDKEDAAEYEVELAKMYVDQGNLGAAETMARAASDFHKGKSRIAALAQAIRARALLNQGKIEEARDAADLSLAMVGRSSDREAELAVGIIAAGVHAASNPKAESSKAKQDLQELAKTARKIGFVRDELEARLALATLEMKSGDRAQARTHLQSLEKDARGSAFVLIASEARAALGTSPR